MGADDKVKLGGIEVPIDADVTGLLAGLEQSGQAIEKHESAWKHSIEVMEGMLGVELVDAVKDFVKEGIVEMAKWDQALDRSANTLKLYGLGYDEAREKLSAYGEKVESLTEFNKIDVVNSLNNVILKTKDWTSAVQINALAMDIVARKGGDLAERANQLTLAFQGVPRGITAISRELGIVGPASKDAGLLIAELEKRFKGAATETENAVSEWHKFTNELGDWGEKAGGIVLPMLTSLSKATRGLFGNDLASAESSVENARFNIERMKRAMADDAHAPTFIGEAHQKELAMYNKFLADAEAKVRKLKGELPGAEGSLAAAAKKNQDQRDAEIKAEKELEAMAGRKEKFTDEQNKQLEREADAKSVLNTLDKTRQTIFERQAIVGKEVVRVMAEIERLQKITVNDGSKASLKHLAELNAEKKQLVDLKNEQQKLREEGVAWAATITGPVSSSMEAFFTKVKQGMGSWKEGFEALATAFEKSMLGALATYLEQLAAVALFKAQGAIASGVGAAAAPGFFAESAIEASGAGAIRAVAAGLAEGGIAHARPGGMIVQVAEGGEDEVISPLSKLKSMMGGSGKGDTHNNTFVFPGVKRQSDVTPGMMKSAARQFADTFNKYKINTGQRNGLAQG